MKIEFTCYDESVTKNFPPVPASKIVPDWYKKIPQDLEYDGNYVRKEGISTIKRCIPVLDYMTSGYVIRNPYHTDAKMLVDENDINYLEHLSVIEKDYLSAHPHSQCPVDMNGGQNHYMKIANMWKVKTPPGYSCLFYQPYYTLNEDFDLFPGIVDTDKHDDTVNFVGLAKRNFELKPGDPLMIVLPFKRDDWEAEIKHEDFRKENRYHYFIKTLWHGTYSRVFHSKKKFR